VESMREGDKRYAEMHFSRDGKTGFQLPHVMRHRSCIIELSFTHEDGEEDDYRFLELAFLSDAIIKECVIALGSLRAGGATYFGRKKKMSLLVRGYDDVDPDRKAPGHFLRHPKDPRPAHVQPDMTGVDPAIAQLLLNHGSMLGLMP